MLYYSVLTVLLDIELFFQHGHEHPKAIKRTVLHRYKVNYSDGFLFLYLCSPPSPVIIENQY